MAGFISAIIAMKRVDLKMLDMKAIELLEKRGLDPELLAKLGLQSSVKQGTSWVSIPYYMDGKPVNHKYRSLEGEKRMSQQEGGIKVVWNYDCLLDESLKNQPLIITEGEYDAIAALQSGYQRVISVPDGAPAEIVKDPASLKYSYLDSIMGLISDCRDIIICSDADGPGNNLLHDLALRLGRERCKFIKYPKGCKDLNDALIRYGQKGVTAAINTAQWMKIGGIYKMSELPPPPERTAHDPDMDGLAKHYKIRLGDLVVVTGVPSMGKTTWVNDVVLRASRNYGWPVCFASFEQHPRIDHYRSIQKWLKMERHVTNTDQWIDDHCSFIVNREEDGADQADLDWVLEKASAAVVRHGAKIVVIDPWNEIEHNKGAMSLTEYTGHAIRQFRRFAQNNGVHVILVAHPTKGVARTKDGVAMPSLYDISDSAHFYNKCDVGIVVHRENENSLTTVHIQKSRYHDIIGVPGKMDFYFDPSNRRFSQFQANQ